MTGYHLHPDPEAGDEPPQIDSHGRTLEGHHKRGDGVKEQRVKKSLLSTVAVRDPAEQQCSDEHACKTGRDETRKAGPVEQTFRSGSEYARPDKTKRKVTHHKESIEFEPATKRDKRDQAAEVSGWRETVETRGNGDWLG